MIKKIIFHLLILGVILLSISLIGNKIDKLNPISKAINEIRFSDIYFSFTKNIKPSTEIYIIDIEIKALKLQDPRFLNLSKQLILISNQR